MSLGVPSDKTAVFMGVNSSFPLEVRQGNPQTVIAPDGIIQGRQQFTLKSEGLAAPVNGDDPNPTNANPDNYIQKGDWIELKREDYFKEVVLPTATKVLNAQTESGMKQLGTAYFTPNSIKIVFNGDDNFFNGVGRGIVFSFETTADADLTGMVYGDTKPINIFGTAYQLKNPDVTAAYSITLSSPGMVKWDQYSYRGLPAAQFVEGAVTWQSTVSAFDQFDNKIKLPLDGKIFYTNPSSYNTSGNVPGIYMPGSFKVNGIEATPSIGGDGSLTYTFPPGTGVDPKVEYKTWIPKESYYYEHKNPPGNLGRSYRVMRGSVQLKQDDDKLVEASQEISFAPDWIQASASYDHSSETIIWKVTVNQYNKKGLKDFTITNILPAGLEFTSATWQTWVDGAASEEEAITPDANSVYSFGDINGKVELVIKSKVINGSNFRIDPRANWNLDTLNGIQNNDVVTGLRPAAVTDEAIVTIGAHNFTKNGSLTMEDFSLGGVTWTVSLAPQYALPDAVVYDVLVHGGDLNVLNNAVDATGEVNAETIAKIKTNINDAQLWKQYHEGTLKSPNGLTLKAIPLTVNGEVVADLIKVTGYTTDQAASFSFRSLETDPNFLFKQDINVGKARWNRALLFDGEVVKSAQNSVNLHVRMLNKDMLFASKPLKVDGTPENVNPNNVSSYIRNDSNEAWTLSAYDRTTKTVTFRLGVNMPGYNTEEMAKDGGNRVISNIKLVDTLPEGWEFVPFSEGKDFELWKGYSDNGSGTEYGVRNDAKTIIEPGTNAHVVSFSKNGNVGTFTFSKLESPYVILVKARPSNAALEKYLEEYTTNGTAKQVLYNKADLHMTWGGEEKVITEQRKVIVPIQTLGKSVTKPTPGVLEWTVNYTPPFNMEQGVYLQDTIGAGMNLRYDANGKLVLTTPSMAVYRAKLTASGALEREGAALDLSDPNAEVQVEAAPGAGGTTVLTFKMKDPNKLYQFVYQTEVDPSKAKAGDKMGNEVKLAGDDKLESISAKSESMLDNSDVAGSSSSNALLALKKVDPDGKPLQGVQFTLYKKGDGTEVAKGTTDSGGNLNLLFPDPGYYELKETYIDTNTWLPTTRIYQVYVGNTQGKPIWVDGVKVTSADPLIVPTPAVGGLKIDNTVTGNGRDSNKEFKYTIIFDGKDKDAEYEYVKDGVKTTIKSGDSIILKHGEAITFPKLLEGLSYTVTQESYQDGGYTTDPESRVYSGAIEKNKVTELKYVNNRTIHGQLLIDNTVTGSGSNKNKDFEYTVTFTGEGSDKSYSYTKSDDTTGTIESGQKIVLKHGEAITVHNLPVGLTYTIQQIDYTNEEYATTPEDFIITGSIEEGKTAEAHYINNREMPGSLLISNTVTGNGSDEEKEFEYTVIFTGAGADKTYDYTKSDGTKGQIKSGDKFHLKHEQTLLIEEILKDTTYVVTEKDYTAEGYTTTPTSREYTGTIKDNETAKAPFENVRYLPGTLALEPKIQKVRGDGKTPVDLTATLTGQDGKPVVGEEVIFIVDGVEVGKATTDENGKATISYTPPKLTDITPKEHKVIAKTDATSPSGVPYNEDNAVVITMPAALTGVLRDNETRKVLPFKEIVVKNVATGEEETITTDSEGRYYHLVQQGEEYTITYKHPVNIGGIQTLVPFTQKAIIEGTDNPIEGNLVPAEITAVGIVLFKQPNGTNSLLTKDFAGNLIVYLKDAAGNYVLENGAPKAFPLEENGTFTAEGLTTGNYTLEVRYEFEPGKELILVKDKVLNLANIDELNISAELVDPYGTVYDKTTGDENTGKKIEGATVTLYYADTPRNRAKGITPGTKVVLPAIPGFAPNDNASPEQYSDIFGFYAYMVFPEADYYLVVTKNGYETYTSPTISVEFDIVQHNVPMKPVSPGGSGEGNPGTGGNPGGSENNPGTGGNPGGSGNNPGTGGNPGGSENDPGTGGNPGGSGNNPGTGGNPGDSGNNLGTGGNPGDSGNNPGTGGNPGDSGNNPGTGGNPGDSGNNPGTGGNPGDSGNNPGTGGNPGDSGNNPGAEGNPGDSGNDLGSVGNQGDSGNNPGSGSNSKVSGNKLNSVDKTESSRNSKSDDNNSGVNKENKLDNVPKTGDNSMPPIFYMALALMSLIMLGFLLFGNKKKKHI